MSVQQQVTEQFERRFGRMPSCVIRAPGRVNLIGEHTDYNDGFVMPLAIELAVWIALSPSSEQKVVACSLDYADQLAEFQLGTELKRESGWAEYLKGVATMLQKANYTLQGWQGIIGSDLPMGAGLSSSAALEMATARAFAEVSGFEFDPPKMATIGQQAENQWVGVHCGIMDQMISAAGKAGHALRIDCRSLETEPVPLPTGSAVVILDTTTRRGLVDSEYNQRRNQCESTAKHFGVKALRDVTLETLETRSSELDPVAYRRARHVITENTRTLQAAKAMHRGDAKELGSLMDASHESLRNDFEVSNDELNTMVECAREEPACYGARMTGAGFGGCAVALVQADVAGTVADSVARRYRAATGLRPKVYITQATCGAQVVDSSAF